MPCVQRIQAAATHVNYRTIKFKQRTQKLFLDFTIKGVQPQEMYEL